MRMRHKHGDTLFREGDPSDFACLILEGTVEVSRDGGGGAKVLLGEAGAGDLVGEMGVLENQPRSATVTATGDVTVEIIPADELIDWICAVPDRARHLLIRLSGKVRLLSNELVAAVRGTAPDPVAEGAPVTEGGPDTAERASLAMIGCNILRGTDRTEGDIDDTFVRNVVIAKGAPPPTLHGKVVGGSAGGGAEGGVVTLEEQPVIALRCRHVGAAASVVVTRLPYRIGRRAPELGMTAGDAATLLVPDTFPHRMSPGHFMIDRDARLGIVVRDLGSDLGTTVNGQFLGGIFAKDTCRLQRGPNVVVAGGLDSPFVFEITVG